jgi:uncharacterized protein YqjF (DUF2071 family)
MTNEVRGQPDRRVFLSAEWRDLVMLNYEAEPEPLTRYVPRGTELDSFAGKTYVSLVGFRFLRTKLFGFVSIPFHTDFDEVNLRFYVRRREGETIKRGVVFIREIVPKRAIALLARLAYGENYTHRPMRHSVQMNGAGISAEYQWQAGCQWNRLHAKGSGDPTYPYEGSVEQFITEHYWGYAKQRGGGSVEYQVTHVPWRVWSATGAGFEGYASDIYGHAFAQILSRPPDSAFIADGSDVHVLMGSRIE